jgi:hypothetical protein
MSVIGGWSQLVDATLYLKGEMECALMGQRFHRGFTAAEKTELWDRWKRGESLKAIGRAFGKPSSSIYFVVAPHGGIRPAQRRRSRLALTLAEREVICRGVTAHQSTRSIARLLAGIRWALSISSRQMIAPLGSSFIERTVLSGNLQLSVGRARFGNLLGTASS